MTQARIVLGAVAIFALSVACTRPDVTADTQPLAPPDTLTPVTTTSTRPQTTTTVHIDRAKIYPVDPITLEAVAGVEPISMGDFTWGISSEDGSWLAMTVGYDDRTSQELRLIDVDNWVVANSWAFLVNNPIHLGDNGTVYVTDYSPTPHLSQLIPGNVIADVIADLPPHFIWYDAHFTDQTGLIFGLVSINDDNIGEAVLVTVDLATYAVDVIPLPEVEIGTIGSMEIADFGPTNFDIYPQVVWGDDGSRVLIVNTNQDVVVEVDAVSGEVDEHLFGLNTLNSTPTETAPFEIGQRSAVIGGANGRVLYVASGVQTFELIDEDLTTRFDPLGIEAIDTETWEVIDRLDAPITDVHLSSDGNRLLATGQSYDDNPQSPQSRSSGFYVIDALDLSVIAHHGGEEPDRYFGGLAMNPGLPIGYVQTWEHATSIDVVDLDVGSIVATRSGGDIQFFAEAGVLVDTSFGTS
ncbi:MAG TPA: hypothetical protein VI193_03585 [Acidimicrobiia bacterium]